VLLQFLGVARLARRVIIVEHRFARAENYAVTEPTQRKKIMHRAYLQTRFTFGEMQIARIARTDSQNVSSGDCTADLAARARYAIHLIALAKTFALHKSCGVVLRDQAFSSEDR
jgi:hypothetical protein